MSSSPYILGISAFYHDSAACLVRGDHIVAAAQEERFSRIKHDAAFPSQAIGYCLTAAGIEPAQLSAAVFYEKPFVKFERILTTAFDYAPRGFVQFVQAVPLWLREKLWIPDIIGKELGEPDPRWWSKKHRRPFPGEVLFVSHHESHAASAFFPSPFESAAILTADGVGEWTTTSLGVGQGNAIELQHEIQYPHSLGLLYSAFTYFTGFKVNSAEYKLMGLAPYGQPTFVSAIRDNLINLRPDGSFELNLEYFDFVTGLRMTHRRMERLFGGPPRKEGQPITQREMDLARSIQVVLEDAMLAIANTLYQRTHMKNLCLAGGVALNCVANSRLRRDGPFSEIWAQPAAGDAGGALGAALLVAHQYCGEARRVHTPDQMQAALLGPSFSDEEIEAFLAEHHLTAERLRPEARADRIAELIDQGLVVGLFQGRMEFGPRALGSRSIIGDARSPRMQSQLNLKIKKRESFRPFAPAVMAEHAAEYFQPGGRSPYMLFTAEVQPAQRVPDSPSASGLEQLKVVRSHIPAVTHVDYSARLQTVSREDNPAFYAVIEAFHRRTGCPVIINTSFNVRGEPIVGTPLDAYACFMSTEMDALVLESFLLRRDNQPPLPPEWRRTFDLD